MIVLDLSILNQKGTPMFNSDNFANRPNFGIVGRIFISTDTSEIYRDTGTSWVLIADTSAGGTITGSGTTGTIPIWSGSTSLGNSSLIEASTLISTTKDIQADAYYLNGAAALNGVLYFTSNRVTLANYNASGQVEIEVNAGVSAATFDADKSATFKGNISAIPSLTAANNAASISAYSQNTLSYAAAFSSNNIGAIYGAVGGVNLQTFAGSATFAQANLASAGVFVNSIDFSSASSTITMTQSSGIRAMTGNQAQLQYQGTNSGTITHAAVQQNLGFYRPSSASGVLTITNAYSHLINALDDYGAGFTFTNRFGIYQAGASDVNYFAASVLIGSNISSGEKFQLTGTAKITGATNVTNAFTCNSLIVGGSITFTKAYIVDNLSATSVGSNFNPGILNIQNSNTTNGNLSLIGFQDASAFINLAAFGAINEVHSSSPNNVKGSLAFYTKDSGTSYVTEKMRLDASGNLGLGVTPIMRLDVKGNVANTAIIGSTTVELISLLRPSNDVGGIRSAFDITNGNAFIFSSQSGASLNFGTRIAPNNNVVMTLHATNNLSLGSVNDTGNRFYLNGSIRIDGQTSGTSSGNSGQHLIINLDGTQYKIKLENN